MSGLPMDHPAAITVSEKGGSLMRLRPASNGIVVAALASLAGCILFEDPPVRKATPELTPWVTPQQIANRGALVVWPAGETRLPPAEIRERFPGLVAEPLQVFARSGRLPPLRIGWAVIVPRPQ